ncbi:MAG: hypothetical protein KF850_02850 [Labilithrix sp.]|nr:hypothetical protein [Labilithrix sp.]
MIWSPAVSCSTFSVTAYAGGIVAFSPKLTSPIASVIGSGTWFSPSETETFASAPYPA